MSELIQNPYRTDYPLNPVRGYNTTHYIDTINEKVTLKDYLQMIQNFLEFCNTNQRVPSYITTTSTKIRVSFELFMYSLSKIITYYQDNNALPTYCIFKKVDISNAVSSTINIQKNINSSTSNNSKIYISSPHYTTPGCNALGQCTPYYCGPHSIHQTIRKFGITKYSEKQIAAWAGTTTSGTSHSGINTAIAKIASLTSIKLSVQWKNFSDMGSTQDERFKNVAKILANKNKAIIWHIGYRNGGNTTTGTIFGHYECIDKINIGTKYVRALNSLGTKKSDGSYTGKLQDRSFAVQSNFAANTPGGQKALCIITRG